MSTDLIDASWIRSVQDFVTGIVDDLVQGRSAVVLLPATVDAVTFRSGLLHAVRARDFGSIQDVCAIDLPSDGLPGAIGDYFEIPWPNRYAARTVTQLVEADALPTMILIHGLEGVSPAAQAAWMRFVSAWAQAAQGRAGRGLSTSRFAVIVSGSSLDSLLPPSNVKLAFHWWWGHPTAIEVRLLCREWEGATNGQALSVWREHLVPSLSGNDTDLAESLCELVTLPLETLLERLHELGIRRGWTRDRLITVGADKVNRHLSFVATRNGAGSEPPASLRRLWALGALDHTPEYGTELHLLAAVLLGWDEVVRHRCWRAQASLLLPRLDGARLAICSRFTERFGRDWPIQWTTPADPDQEQAVRKDPLACEWGYLKYLVEGPLPCNGRDRDLIEAIRSAWWTRNQLAHYQAIDYHTFERLWKRLEEIVRR